MKAKIFLLITFLTFLCRASESVVVDCEFYDAGLWGYACNVQNSELITSKDDREISEVRGQHESGKSNDDVKYFHSNSKKLSFFPTLTKVFKNIDSVGIRHTKVLKEILRDDLKQFNGRLINLSLYEDGIEVIEADLFEDNQNLEFLELSSNNIRHIEAGALTKLKKLSNFIFDNNPCEELSTIEETEKACNPDIITTTIKALTTTTKEITSTSSSIQGPSTTTTEAPKKCSFRLFSLCLWS